MTKLRVNMKDDDSSWWDEYRGAIIFFSVAGVFIVFGVAPWLIGCARIVQWIVK